LPFRFSSVSPLPRSQLRPPRRHIAVANIATGKVTIFKDIPSDNCFCPVWSSDGSKLAFHIFANKEWHLGWVNADGSDFHLLKDVKPRSDNPFARLIDTIWAPAWASDAKSIFCHDLANVYQIDLDENVLKKWEAVETPGSGAT
jgi:TolB protein